MNLSSRFSSEKMAPKSRSKRGNLKNSDNKVENQVQESKNGVRETDLPKNQTGTFNNQEVRIGFLFFFYSFFF